MRTEPPADLLDTLADRLGHTHDGPVVVQWSQVGSAHTGRMIIDGARSPLPHSIGEVFRDLHTRMVDPEHGIWFSAHAEQDGDGGFSFSTNYTDRVYWNSEDLFTPPTGADPVPTDAEWAGELNRHPRSVEHVPPWLGKPTRASNEFVKLREALNSRGVALPAVRLPGEKHTTFEGAVLVRSLESAFFVDVFDYGQLVHLTQVASEREAGVFTWNYLTSPLPSPTMLPAADIAGRLQATEGAYRELGQRIVHAGPGGIVTNLAPGALYDRWGGLDGLYVFEWDTPLDQRALPPSASEKPAQRVGLIAREPIPAQAEFAPAWFDQAGGGVRFRLRSPVRDLVRSGALAVVRVV